MFVYSGFLSYIESKPGFAPIFPIHGAVESVDEFTKAINRKLAPNSCSMDAFTRKYNLEWAKLMDASGEVVAEMGEL